MRNLLVAIGVFGSFGLAGSAQAKWGDNEHASHGSAPPGVIRSEFSLRGASDGRADLHQDRAGHADRYATTVSKPLPDRDYGQMKHGAPVPLKSQIALRMQNGDSREGSAAKQKVAEAASRATPDNSFGRAKPAAPVPMKMEIAIRMQHGDNREGGSNKQIAQRPGDASSRSAEHKGLAKPLSFDQKVALCRQTGVCLPLLMSTDNSDDKSE